MTRIVLVCFRPLPGKESALTELLKEHVPILRSQGLATTRDPLFLSSNDGVIVEIFEWVSEAAIEAAHQNPQVRAMWERFNATCEFVSLSGLSESQGLFATFSPLMISE